MKKYTIKNRIQKQQRENYLEPKVPMHQNLTVTQYKFFSKKKKKNQETRIQTLHHVELCRRFANPRHRRFDSDTNCCYRAQ
jgi:hypothetical protein